MGAKMIQPYHCAWHLQVLAWALAHDMLHCIDLVSWRAPPFVDTSPQEAGETHVPMNAEAAEVAGSHTGRVATYILTEVPSAVHQGHRMGVVGTYLVVAFDRSIHQSQAPPPWEVHPCDASLCDQASFKVFGCLQRRASIEANRMSESTVTFTTLRYKLQMNFDTQ